MEALGASWWDVQVKLNLTYEITLPNGNKETLKVSTHPQDKAAFEADLKEIYGVDGVKEVK